ncbi:MAG TPA: nitrous oxide reductase accessory protein NosL [Saprospiraceae bacterium]|nr:nitrous oxide reductase accessory protein NosL [Saprospiraceae bacterium]HRK80977.1 nitrous oxide reductase accessory protein NosL [Saprospiraceae bacterium]
MKKLFYLSIMILAAAACTPTAKPIEYGADACYYCKMTIVDRQHAAEAVSAKGKVFMFDAIECMVPYLALEGEDNYPVLVVNDYLKPGEWADARSATYLISKGLPSPMGAFLTGFADRAAAEPVQQEKGGELYNWESMKQAIAR